MQRRIEGPSIKGKRVLVVEDTTTTGASPTDAVRWLQRRSAASSARSAVTARVVSRSSIAASASGLGHSAPPARLIRLPSRSADTSSGTWAFTLKSSMTARSCAMSPPRSRCSVGTSDSRTTSVAEGASLTRRNPAAPDARRGTR